MTTAILNKPQKETPLLFDGLTWREFKAVEQLLDRSGYRLSFLDGVLEIIRMPGAAHEIVKKRIAALLEPYLHIKSLCGMRNFYGNANRYDRGCTCDYRVR